MQRVRGCKCTARLPASSRQRKVRAVCEPREPPPIGCRFGRLLHMHKPLTSRLRLAACCFVGTICEVLLVGRPPGHGRPDTLRVRRFDVGSDGALHRARPAQRYALALLNESAKSKPSGRRGRPSGEKYEPTRWPFNSGESNARLDGSGVWAAGADVKSVTTIRIRREHCSPAGGDPRASAKSLVRAWLEVVGDTRTHGAAHHPTRAGFLPSKRQTHYSSIRRCHISELLDATVRSCRPPPVAGESGLRGGERREHRDDVLQL